MDLTDIAEQLACGAHGLFPIVHSPLPALVMHPVLTNSGNRAVTLRTARS